MTYASSKEMHAGCSFCVGDIDPTGCKLALGVCHSRTSFTPLFCMKDLHFIMCKECWQCISPSLRVLSRISRLSPTYLALTDVNAIHKCICVLHKSCAECWPASSHECAAAELVVLHECLCLSKEHNKSCLFLLFPFYCWNRLTWHWVLTSSFRGNWNLGGITPVVIQYLRFRFDEGNLSSLTAALAQQGSAVYFLSFYRSCGNFQSLEMCWSVFKDLSCF